LFLNQIERNSPERSEDYKRKRDCTLPRTTNRSFHNPVSASETLTDGIKIGAQYLYKTITFFPSSAFTLCCLVPRCCRVMLQPGLGGQNSIPFWWLQGAETLVPKPD
ncbi:hypothetical protein, partial [Pedobacter sp.]|uniref:hypothetical protein n=1 Tax=Pedobacter sp. TaxID=1411316 RepID=UPI0031DA4248